MSQRFIYFLVVLLLMFAKENFAQDTLLNRSTHTIKGTSKVLCNGEGWNTKFYLKIKPQDCFKLPINYESLKNFEFENRLRMDFFKDSSRYNSTSVDQIKINFTGNLITKSILKPAYYSENIGFVCKKELQLEKLTSIPLRFRVGSLDYTNYLEQKPNAIKPAY